MPETRACKGGATLPCRIRNLRPGQQCQSCGLSLPDKNVNDPHYGFVAWCLDAPILSQTASVGYTTPTSSGNTRERLGHMEERRIRCTKPHYYEPQGGWELSKRNRGRSPVIVILDPQRVSEYLANTWPYFKPIRLANVMRIPENGYLELPEVRFHEFDDCLKFLQGRHRTTALAKLGFTAYPAVTADDCAAGCIAKFGASVDEARRHFDWDGIEYPVMGI